MRNYFPKRPSGAPLHTLSKLYDVPVGFVSPPPLFWVWILLILRSPKGGCCSISDDLSCSYNKRDTIYIVGIYSWKRMTRYLLKIVWKWKRNAMKKESSANDVKIFPLPDVWPDWISTGRTWGTRHIGNLRVRPARFAPESFPGRSWHWNSWI